MTQQQSFNVYLYICIYSSLKSSCAHSPIDVAANVNGGAVFFERLVGKNKAGLWLLWVDSKRKESRGDEVGRTKKSSKNSYPCRAVKCWDIDLSFALIFIWRSCGDGGEQGTHSGYRFLDG